MTDYLDVRVFDDVTKKMAYKQQTAAAEKKGVSNCPDCALGHDANKAKLWTIKDMDADHVSPWSRGGGNRCEQLPDAVQATQSGQRKPVTSRFRINH